MGLPAPLSLSSQLVTASPKRRSINSCIPRSGLSRSDFVVCPACSIAWWWKSPVQPDGGEGRAKHKGVIARWRLKAVRSEAATW